MASQAKPWFRTSLECFVKLLESNKKAIGLCTAQSKMLLFCVKAITKESHNFELVHLKKKTNFGHFATFWFGTYAMHFHGVLQVMKTLEEDWYVVAKFTFVLSYVVCPHYPYI